MAAVVGHQLHYVGSRLEFVLEDNEILVSEAYDAVDLSAQVVELLCDGVCDSAAHAAAYYSDFLQTFSVARNAEGSYEVVNELALFEVVQLFSRSAHDLEDDRDSALFSVKVRDSQRDSLSLCVNSEDYELSRFSLLGDHRSVNFHKSNCGVEDFLGKNLVHSPVSS